MNIVCPQCGFARQVSEEKLPAASVIATCPHCRNRFRIHKDMPVAAPVEQEIPPSAPAAPAMSVPPAMPATSGTAVGEDDPLPPGAVIPRSAPEDSLAVQKQPAPDAKPVRVTPAEDAQTQQQAPPQSGSREEEQAQPLSEEEKDFRRAAAAAYEKQAEEGQSEQDFALDNPWEYPQREGYPASFYQTCVRVMFVAPRFFAGLKPDTPQRLALIFFLIVCVAQILIERLWGSALVSVLGPEAASDPQLQKLLEVLNPPSNMLLFLLTRTAFLTMQLFAMSALYFLVFKLITPQHANYQLIFQVMAYSSAPGLLCIVPVAGTVAGFIWGIACSFVGCRYALRLSWQQTLMGLVPIYVLSVPFIFMLAQGIN